MARPMGEQEDLGSGASDIPLLGGVVEPDVGGADDEEQAFFTEIQQGMQYPWKARNSQAKSPGGRSRATDHGSTGDDVNSGDEIMITIRLTFS